MDRLDIPDAAVSCASFSSRVIQANILTGSHQGLDVSLPRILYHTLDTIHNPIAYKRRQFPIRPAFAMIINKAQGQTFSVVGLCLKEPVFTYGQLYVALSCCKYPRNIFVVTSESSRTEAYTRNIVYRRIFH